MNNQKFFEELGALFQKYRVYIAPVGDVLKIRRLTAEEAFAEFHMLSHESFFIKPERYP